MNEIQKIKYNRIVSKFNTFYQKCEINELKHTFTCRYNNVKIYGYGKQSHILFLYYDDNIKIFDTISTDKIIISRLLCESFSKTYGIHLSTFETYHHSKDG